MELLPPALSPAEGLVLQDGIYLGVSKKVLAQAYLIARKVFFKNQNDLSLHSPTLGATDIILLFDPEHLTAANYRKKRLVELHQEPSEHSNIKAALNEEIYFVTSILTSPLHRQSKSPTLWYHRLWLLNFAFDHKLCNRPLDERPQNYARQMLNPVFKSGEQHPKNYYAWQFARNMLLPMQKLPGNGAKTIWETWFDEFLLTCATTVSDWCCRHPSDTSGWSYLIFLLPKLRTLEHRTMIIKEILEFAIHLHCRQESLWIFIRTVLADETISHERYPLIMQLKAYAKKQCAIKYSSEPESDSYVTQAIRWIDLYKHT
ncbi:hypothetical protein GQ43DRAFT_369121 [Delitschia confertaspora ATCC 74209]|uniref:Protein prenylyltransferase n=1 Tax=Delitschia confertaspora ATCC 74209 TaxID=1513339 RepID=A0A9P4MTV6_9PLEO|nr:hypothetical protein GQ43DRAFT_369121 [Delitschia confertaspora ATCC 74209]